MRAAAKGCLAWEAHARTGFSSGFPHASEGGARADDLATSICAMLLAKRGGNKRTVDERELVNALLYILSTGCQWAALPRDLPPWSTFNAYFCRWNHDRTLDRIHHAIGITDSLRPAWRECSTASWP
jgi:transposase